MKILIPEKVKKIPHGRNIFTGKKIELPIETVECEDIENGKNVIKTYNPRSKIGKRFHSDLIRIKNAKLFNQKDINQVALNLRKEGVDEKEIWRMIRWEYHFSADITEKAMKNSKKMYGKYINEIEEFILKKNAEGLSKKQLFDAVRKRFKIWSYKRVWDMIASNNMK